MWRHAEGKSYYLAINVIIQTTNTLNPLPHQQTNNPPIPLRYVDCNWFVFHFLRGGNLHYETCVTLENLR